MVLESNGQPETLDQLKKEYYLVEFDGSSDDALEQTWNIKGEQAVDGNPH